MKFLLLTVCVFLLTVSSSLSVNITVTGTEGREVEITCPYREGYAYSYKYFYKGFYHDREILLESNGLEPFVMSSRFFLKDDRRTKSFTVTIGHLEMSDAGLYGCKAGYGIDNHNQVELIVIRAPETTTTVQISTTTITPFTTVSSEHTSTELPVVAIALGLGVLLLILCSGLSVIMNVRKRKRRSATNAQLNTETHRMYETPNTDFNPAASSYNQTPASHLNNDSTAYTTVSNRQPHSNPNHTPLTNQVTDTNCDYYGNIKSPEATQDSGTELLYPAATHPLNITTDEDPLDAPRFVIN